MVGLTGRILITGGAGFLGRGIMRQAHRDGWDAQFTVFSRNERTQAQCRYQFPGAHYVLGDVCDTDRLALTMCGHDLVIHAAALKYIPEGEFNASECTRVNVDGARSVIGAARAADVKRVVGISTDKASQPVNVYGMTKALMERLFTDAGESWGCTFTTVRYGNVVGSTGSVVPVMLQQFHDYKHVTITDPYMTRFWMPVDEAVATIVRAFDASPGAVVVPSPGAASMNTMAYAVLGAAGSAIDGESHVDQRIKIVGRRPGEKQHEDLISHYELFRTRREDDYWEILPPGNENYSDEHPNVNSHTAHKLTRETLAEWVLDSMTV